MRISKGGINWKSTYSRLPLSRALLPLVFRTRPLLLVGAFVTAAFLWHGIQVSARQLQTFYCWGPHKSPVEMSMEEQTAWSQHLKTPVVFNHHKAVEVDNSSIIHINLNSIDSTPQAVANEERVLILTPLKDAAPYLGKYFELLDELTYPHRLIDIAFLVSDITDDTLAILASELKRIQASPQKFNSATVVEKDFGFTLNQDVEERHSFEAQAPRRKAMGRARNYLLSVALKPNHSWVYWRDVDIVESPKQIIEDFIAHDRDILVPNIWFHRFRDGIDIEGRFDYNSWVETDQGRRLAKSLDPDVVLAEGYKQYKTGRTYLARMGNRHKNKDEEIELDAVGGVNIIVKADVHRSGINFPCYAFENQAETEGFGKMAKRAKYGVYGLPNYVVWHIDTKEKSNA